MPIPLNFDRELELLTYVEAINDGDDSAMEEFEPITETDVKPLLFVALTLAGRLKDSELFEVREELTEIAKRVRIAVR